MEERLPVLVLTSTARVCYLAFPLRFHFFLWRCTCGPDQGAWIRAGCGLCLAGRARKGTWGGKTYEEESGKAASASCLMNDLLPAAAASAVAASKAGAKFLLGSRP